MFRKLCCQVVWDRVASVWLDLNDGRRVLESFQLELWKRHRTKVAGERTRQRAHKFEPRSLNQNGYGISIGKHLRRAFRAQRDSTCFGWIQGFGLSTHHARAPSHPCSTKEYEECPGPGEFANFLEHVFASEIGFESPNFKTLPDHLRVKGARKKNLSVREMKPKGFRESERFTVGEV